MHSTHQHHNADNAAHLSMDVWHCRLVQALILLLAYSRGRQAQVQYACKDVAGTVCKGAVFSNLQAIQLNDSQVLIVAHLHTPQEGF